MDGRWHRLLRRGPGDYLLVSNDRRTLWRIRRYLEDGTVQAGAWPNEKPLLGTFWKAETLEHDVTVDGEPLIERDRDGTIAALRDPHDPAWDGASWDVFVSLLARRTDAIAEIAGGTKLEDQAPPPR